MGDQLIFSLMGLEKQSRPNNVRGTITVPSGSRDAQSLSTAVYCQAYLVRTKERRAEHADVKGSRSDKFFISDTKVRIS